MAKSTYSWKLVGCIPVILAQPLTSCRFCVKWGHIWEPKSLPGLQLVHLDYGEEFSQEVLSASSPWCLLQLKCLVKLYSSCLLFISVKCCLCIYVFAVYCRIRAFIVYAFSALMLLVWWQEWHLACKKTWVVGCWHGCLSGVRCRFAYSPALATATATHCLLLQ